MNLPVQAPPVIRETFTWQDRLPSEPPGALLPASVCCHDEKECTDGAHEWCCPQNMNCGTFVNQCTGLPK
jgi:hypothetical protein